MLKVIASLQRRYGEAYASEAGLRKMIADDTGHMPGVRTLTCALERLERQGVLKQVWLQPGDKRTGRPKDRLPTGELVKWGTRAIYIARCRRERFAFRSHARLRREENQRRFLSLTQARTAIAQAVASVTPALSADAWEARRQAQLAAARAFVAEGLDVAPPKPPPD